MQTLWRRLNSLKFAKQNAYNSNDAVRMYVRICALAEMLKCAIVVLNVIVHSVEITRIQATEYEHIHFNNANPMDCLHFCIVKKELEKETVMFLYYYYIFFSKQNNNNWRKKNHTSFSFGTHKWHYAFSWNEKSGTQHKLRHKVKDYIATL